MFAEWDGSRHNIHSNAKHIMDRIRGGRSSNEYLAMGGSGVKPEEPIKNGIDNFAVRPGSIAEWDQHPVGTQPEYNMLRSGPPALETQPLEAPKTVSQFVPKKEGYYPEETIFVRENGGFFISKDVVYLFVFFILFVLIINLYFSLQKTYHVIADLIMRTQNMHTNNSK